MAARFPSVYASYFLPRHNDAPRVARLIASPVLPVNPWREGGSAEPPPAETTPRRANPWRSPGEVTSSGFELLVGPDRLLLARIGPFARGGGPFESYERIPAASSASTSTTHSFFATRVRGIWRKQRNEREGLAPLTYIAATGAYSNFFR